MDVLKDPINLPVKPTLWVPVGFPGSGKTTWTREAVKDSATMSVSRDAIRHMVKDGDYFFHRDIESSIREAALNMICLFLRGGFNVVADETNLKPASRMELVDMARSMGAMTVCILLPDPGTAELVRRRMLNARGYTDAQWTQIIEGMRVTYQEPTPLECFDEIIRLNSRNF